MEGGAGTAQKASPPRGGGAAKGGPINPPGEWDAMISYCTRDALSQVLSREIERELGKRGKTVWLDVRMDSKSEAAMEEGVRNARCVIAVVSGPVAGQGDDTAYFSREFCLKELRWAVDAGVFIQPVVRAENRGKISDFCKIIPDDLEFLKSTDWLHLDDTDREFFELGITKVLRGDHWTAERKPRALELDDEPFGAAPSTRSSSGKSLLGSPALSATSSRDSLSRERSLSERDADDDQRLSSLRLTRREAIYYSSSQKDPASLREVAVLARTPLAELMETSEDQFQKILRHLEHEKQIRPMCNTRLVKLQREARAKEQAAQAKAAELRRQSSMDTAVKARFAAFIERVGGAEPLRGLDEIPVPDTLSEAVQFIADCEDPGTPSKAALILAVKRAYEFAAALLSKGPDILNKEEIAAINIYTQDKWTGSVRSIYLPLNAALRGQDREEVKVYWAYIRLLQQALFKLPRDESGGTLARAFPFGRKLADLEEKLHEFEQLKSSGHPEIWWGYSSSSTSLQAAHKFMGSEDQLCVQYLIDAGSSARDVRRYSVYQDGAVPEEERLLPMGSAFEIKDAVIVKGNVLQVAVKQVDKFVLPVTEEPTAEELEAKQDELGRADLEMAAGTQIFVVGLGRGTYKAFTRSWPFGANTHTISFDAGREEELQLRDLESEWSVLSERMDQLEAAARQEAEALALEQSKAKWAPFRDPVQRMRETDDPSVARHACRELRDQLFLRKADGTVALSQQAKEMTAQAGGVPAVGGILKKFKGATEVEEEALKMLRVLVDGNEHENCEALREADGVEPVVAAMQAQPEAAVITESGCVIIMNMAMLSKRAAKEIVAAHSVSVLIHVLLLKSQAAAKDKLDDRSIVTLTAGCDALVWLVINGPPSVSAEVEASNVVKVLSAAMPQLQERYPDKFVRTLSIALGSLDKRVKVHQRALRDEQVESEEMGVEALFAGDDQPAVEGVPMEQQKATDRPSEGVPGEPEPEPEPEPPIHIATEGEDPVDFLLARKLQKLARVGVPEPEPAAAEPELVDGTRPVEPEPEP